MFSTLVHCICRQVTIKNAVEGSIICEHHGFDAYDVIAKYIPWYLSIRRGTFVKRMIKCFQVEKLLLSNWTAERHVQCKIPEDPHFTISVDKSLEPHFIAKLIYYTFNKTKHAYMFSTLVHCICRQVTIKNAVEGSIICEHHGFDAYDVIAKYIPWYLSIRRGTFVKRMIKCFQVEKLLLSNWTAENHVQCKISEEPHFTNFS